MDCSTMYGTGSAGSASRCASRACSRALSSSSRKIRNCSCVVWLARAEPRTFHATRTPVSAFTSAADGSDGLAARQASSQASSSAASSDRGRMRCQRSSQSCPAASR